jgi:acetyl-CoA carboxylase biotin carboxyl carrier protein
MAKLDLAKLDTKTLNGLIDLLKEQGVGEFEYETEGGRITLTFGGGMVVPMAAPVAVAASPAPDEAEAAPDRTGTEVKSPMVGTMYRSPKPDSPAFVDVGQTVAVGQTLCIIEAMKLMNEIEAEVAGKLVEILVDNGQPVQFGQVLFVIEPS